MPFVGILFNILDEEENFYKDFGRSAGFEIIIRNTHRHSRSNKPSSRLFIFRKGGRFGMTPLNLKNCNIGKRIRDVILGTKCNARMCVVHKVKIDK